jgi:hypothetical protein
MGKLRPAVIDMCKCFEEGLSSFIKTLVVTDAKDNTTKQCQQEELEPVEKQKRKRVAQKPKETAKRRKQQGTHEESIPVVHSVSVGATTTEPEIAPPLVQEQAVSVGRPEDRDVMGHENEQVIAMQSPFDMRSPVNQDCEQARKPNVPTELPLVLVHVPGSCDVTPEALKQTELPYATGHVSGSFDVTPDTLKPTELPNGTPNVPGSSGVTPDALKQLQIYGTCSKSNHEKDQAFQHLDDQMQNIISSKDSVETRTQPLKSEGDTCSPIRSRPVTRSTSPKLRVSTAKKVADSPRRLTRFATAQARAKQINLYRTGEAKEVEMNRNLNSQFQSAQEEMESDSQRARRVLIEDCPSFDLGFHSQSQGNACDAKELHGTQLELVVVSSNDDSGDTLDKIYSNIELPTVTPASEIKPLSEEAIVTSAAHSSCTPVPQAHQKRVVKLAQNQKSPFVQYDKMEVATKFANEVYSRICSFGGDTDDEANNAKIIDYGTNYVYLRDLADSVRPRAWLSNSTCDLALHVLRIEMAKQKKHVMPLRLAVSSYKL